MKRFIETFIICIISLGVFLFFFGWLIFNSLFGILACISLVLTIAITTFIELEDRIEKLEQRIGILEGTAAEQRKEDSGEVDATDITVADH